MQINRSKEFWLAKAEAEGDSTIGAGNPGLCDFCKRALEIHWSNESKAWTCLDHHGKVVKQDEGLDGRVA